MARMLRVELRVPGEYRDLWLYKERLHLWDRDGVLHFIKFDTVLKHVVRRYGLDVANILQTLVFRNDWKAGEQFSSWMRVPTVAEAVLAPLRRSDHLVIDLPDVLFAQNESQSYSGLVLDTNIYADRVYFATAEGLLESYINAKKPEAGYELNQQTDFRASRVAVKFSAINLSAEDRGLYFAPVRFWSNELIHPSFMKADWHQVADFSLASSFARRNLLNYTQSAVPSLLYARIEEHRSDRARYDDTVVVGYDSTPADLMDLTYAAASSSSKATTAAVARLKPRIDESFEILGNSDYHLLTSRAGQLQVIDLRASEGRELEASPNYRFEGSKLPVLTENILATYAISRGFVVEYYDRLHLITAEGAFALAEGEAAQVRTFESSKRHKETIAVVQEESASVFGYYIAHEIDDLLF